MGLSVLMSVYAAEKPEYLAASLLSLVRQSRPAEEVVLVEDGPISQELRAVIDEHRASLNIVSVPLPKNVGLAAALNEGLKHCKQPLIARMDSDDIALPHRFATQIRFMNEATNVAASSSYVEEFFEGTPRRTLRTVPLTHIEIVRYAKFRTPLSHPAAIYRAAAVRAIDGYPLLYPEDQAIWAMFLARGFELANIPDVLVEMRTNDSFFARRGWKLFKGQLNVLNFRHKIGVVNIWEYCLNLIFLALVRLPPSQLRALLFSLSRRRT
jgi:glycosyltransferase involved in cell wall biosynthesis